jgi:hypothetical protein
MSTLHSCGAVHIEVGGEGRCTECFFHVPTQGHRACCSGTAPIEPPSIWTDSFLENVRRRKSAQTGRYDPGAIHEWLDAKPPKRSSLADAAQPGGNPRYVAAAIRADLERLAATHEGRRNSTLHAVACNVFEFVKAGHADEAAVRAELERIAAAIGLGHHEIQSTLRSAWNKVGPRHVPVPRGAA